jgi:dihydrofolate synthase/folylpolyglutamate synthase
LSAPFDEGVGAVNMENLPVAGLLPINKTLALQALLCAGFQLNGEKCRVALDNMFLRGRQQRLTYQGVNLILDVAHNPAAAAVLAAELAAQQVSQISSGKGRYIAVAAVLEDKDWSAMVTALKPVIDDWKVAQLQGVTRSADGQSLLNLLYNNAADGTLHNSVEQAFISALSEADSGDTVAVFGSFYTVAEVLRLISKGENSEQ